MSGIAYCYNVTTGELLVDIRMQKTPIAKSNGQITVPRRYPQGFIAEGKYYSGYFEHSPNQPLPRGAPFVLP